MGTCPICNSETAKDFEEQTIYCTGCSLEMRSDYMDSDGLDDEWDNITANLLNNLAKQKNVPSDFVALVNSKFWELL